VKRLLLVVIIIGLLAFFFHHRRPERDRRDVASSPSVEEGPVGQQGERRNVASSPSGGKKRVGPDEAYPSPSLTPGATDPGVTQDDIQSTICVPGYTKTVRPPETITHNLKLQIMETYRASGELRDYELDHFIPLELGGCPDCVSNLWPEPYGSNLGARQKDQVENYLHREVCSGNMTLTQAQDAIRTDWAKVYYQISQN
jgi:hypothetical protein